MRKLTWIQERKLTTVALPQLILCLSRRAREECCLEGGGGGLDMFTMSPNHPLLMFGMGRGWVGYIGIVNTR